MVEIWLRPNVRVLWISLLFPLALTAVCGVVFAAAEHWPATWLWRAMSAVGIVIGAIAAVAILRELRTPRLAYFDGVMRVHLRPGPPIATPIEIVEAFLLGQGPGNLPGKSNARRETAVINIRLAERAAEWAKVDVSPQLGKWCGGYITILGTCCEPLSIELVQSLNRRLHEAQQAVAAANLAQRDDDGETASMATREAAE